MGTREPETVMSGTLDQHSGKFSGFSLRFIFPRHRAKETGDPEMLTGAANKSPDRSPLFLPKGPGKGQISKTENFQEVTVPLKLNNRNNLLHNHVCQRRTCEEPDLNHVRL